MVRRLVHFRHVVRRLTGLAFVASLAVIPAPIAGAGVAEGKEGLAELGKADARLKAYFAPRGFHARIVAAEPTLVDPAAMAFDDQGHLFVAEWRPADRSFETTDTLGLPDGGTARVRRGRKSSLDVIKRLKDGDGDGVYESGEVVLDGCEMPTAILPYKNSLYLTCAGRLERWSDEDGDGFFENRAVLADGFAAMDRRGLSGITLGADGWLYLTSGDNDNHVVGPDGSRVDLSRTGGVFRMKLDGSKLAVFAMGLRNPFKGLAFDATFDPFLLDGDLEDGSKFQGVRLVNPVEDGDYGWRLRPGASVGLADFDRGAVSGERPGKLPVMARLGRGSPQGLVIYNGLALPDAFRETLIQPDASRRIVRGFKVEPKGGSHALKGEFTLLTAEDDQFRPCQVAIGADGALYVLDRRGHSAGDASPGGESKAGRLYRITWEGDGFTPPLKTKDNHWQRLFNAPNDELIFRYMASPDHLEADRALRELLDRGGPSAVLPCMAWATNATATLHTRLLGIQGLRQFWSDQIEGVMISLLGDPNPDIRRLAAQSLAWDSKSAQPRLVPKLLPLLDDVDGRVAREAALAIGRHAEPRPQQAAATLLRWLFAHPQADPPVGDGFVRALERLGECGVEEVALAIRTRRGVEREAAVALYSAFRTAPAAERLDGLVKIPDLTPPERLALVRQFQDFPLHIPVPTQGLAEWIGKHGDVDPSVKLAALEACRLGGNPASSMVLAMLDDEDETVRHAATRVAALSRPPGAVAKLLERLGDKQAPADERSGLVEALGTAGPKAFAALDAAYLASDDPEFRKVALRSMADADRTKATPALESALSGPDPALRASAARILGESPRTAPMLGKAYLNRALHRDELPIVLASLRRLDGKENRKLLAAIEEDASGGSGSITSSEIRPKVAQGDPWAGLGVFFRESSRCSTCHKVEGRGGNFGPPLNLSGPAPSTDKLIESILAPSRAVSKPYETTRVTLKEGRTFLGILKAKDARSITLIEPDGREVRIAADLIDSESREPGSLMPAHVSLDLTPAEIVDLVAFLQSKPARDSLKHGPTRLDRAFAIGPFAPGADRLRVPLDRVDASRPFAGQDGAPAAWITQESSPWGTLNLRGQLGGKPGRVYLAAQVQSGREQAAALRLAAEGAVRVYLNGSRVADVPQRDPTSLARSFARPPSTGLAPLPDLSRLALKPGGNLLIIAIDRADPGPGDFRAAFEIASPEPVEIRTPRN